MTADDPSAASAKPGVVTVSIDQPLRPLLQGTFFRATRAGSEFMWFANVKAAG